MRISKRHLLGLVAALPMAWLAACGGGDKGNDATVRLVNASPGYASLDLYVEDTKEVSGVAFGTGSEYTGVTHGEVSNVLTATDSSTELLDKSVTLGSGKKYTIVAYGWEGALKSVYITDDVDAADTNKTKVSVFNGAVDAGDVDVYLTEGDTPLASSDPIASAVKAGITSPVSTNASGTFKLSVTGAGNPDDIRLQIDGVVLNSTKVVTLVLSPGQGGMLVNAVGVEQDGAVTPYLNTKARVRMVAAVGTDAVPFSNVSVTARGTSLGTLGSFTYSDYVLVDAGSMSLVSKVDGTTVDTRSITLEAGADATVIVTGSDASDAQVQVVSDENRLPSATSRYKIRMIHAETVLAGEALSMQVDGNRVVSSLPFGEASDFIERTTSGGTSTIVISTNTFGDVYTLTDQTLVSQGVYTVFVFQRSVNGDVSTYAVAAPSR